MSLAAVWLYPAAQVRAAESLRLRVVSLNVRAFPGALPRRSERLAALAPALTALAPDVVVLQGAWPSSGRERIAAALKDAGLKHHRYFRSRIFGSGLFVAARYPIEQAAFEAFDVSGGPHKPRELDWYGGKGFASCLLQTPVGPLRIVNAHLQAAYPADSYERVRYAQLVQLVGGLADASAPLVVAGDLSHRLDDQGMRSLTGRAGLRFAGAVGSSRVDHVLARDGGGLRADIAAFHLALDEPVDLGGGQGRLSDRPALVAEVVLSSGAARPPARGAPAPAVTADDLHATAQALRGELKRCLALGVLLLFGGVFLEAAAKRTAARACVLLLLGAALVLFAFATQYLGPQAEGCDRAAVELLRAQLPLGLADVQER